MKSKDIVIGIVVLAFVAGAAFYFNKDSENDDLKVPETLSIEDRIEDSFKIEIPEDVDKAELTESENGSGTGLATRKKDETRTDYTVLADLPDSKNGSFYQAWIVNDEDDYVSLGSMRVAKGGYITEYTTGADLSSYDSVKVTQETVFDTTPETTILEGGF